MTISDQIEHYIAGHPDQKRNDMRNLHRIIMDIMPQCKLWFLDGKNDENKVVSNPNIGYGSQTTTYASGKTKEFYRIGMSANSTGISIYIMGIADKNYLPKTYGNQLGKASVTGYCIKFKTLEDIDVNALEAAIRYGADHPN